MDKLDLRKQIVEDTKAKKGLTTKAQVVVAMDRSGSMSYLYETDKVQELVERLFPLALSFDDNGELDFYTFDSGFKRKPSVTLDNHRTYISQFVASDEYGATEYAPVLAAIMEDKTKKGGFLGWGAKDIVPEQPVYVIFITDGNNSDHAATDRVIREMSRKGIFVQCVGIGSSSFDYLERLDNLSGRLIDNVNFFSAGNIDGMSDEVLYDKLLTEFPGWIPLAKSNNLIA